MPTKKKKKRGGARVARRESSKALHEAGAESATATDAVDYESEMSVAEAVKALVASLHARADQKRDPWFSRPEINAAARAAGVQTSIPLGELVDILREHSYLT